MAEKATYRDVEQMTFREASTELEQIVRALEGETWSLRKRWTAMGGEWSC